ncbi:PRTRC system protein F [Paraburkholderia phymatum]|uniref:PRTRC system protein F n=1 Tax=Paraburkholderia phymatum TaxID=148447 RepID=A0ACC6U7W3_9BURK
MLFDPSTTDSRFALGAGGSWQPPRAPFARRGPAADFLTLPSVGDDVPQVARVKWREDVSLTGIVRKHFLHGPLRAADVNDPIDAGDAFQQAFFAWAKRHTGPLARITIQPRLFDSYAVRDVLRYTGTASNDEDPSPMFFALESPEEWVCSFGPMVSKLRAAHPLLLRTVMSVINRAAWRTVWMRTPDWFMYEFACWYWEGDESITDADAEEMLKERFGEDAEARKAYLPSTVRPMLCPDDAEPSVFSGGRWRLRPALDDEELLALRSRSRGTVRRVCTELLRLNRLMHGTRRKRLFDASHETNPVYAGCGIVIDGNEFISDILDCHFDSESQSGEATTYHGFIALGNNARAIRRQYADWTLGFSILKRLDSLLALVTHIV